MLPATLTATPADSELSLSITILDDDDIEPSEVFFISFSAADYGGQPPNPTLLVAINDNEHPRE